MSTSSGFNDLLSAAVVAAARFGLPEEIIRRVVQSDYDLKSLIAFLLRIEKGNPYASEKRVSSHGRANNIIPTFELQRGRLRQFFPKIDLNYVDELSWDVEYPKGHDQIVLVPKLSFLGKTFKVDDPYCAGYGLMRKPVVQMIADSRQIIQLSRFCKADEWPGRPLHPVAMIQTVILEESVPGDVLVLPLSLGNLYVCHSGRNVFFEAFLQNQLPLGYVQVGCLLAMYPRLLSEEEDLTMLCPADMTHYYICPDRVTDRRWEPRLWHNTVMDNNFISQENGPIIALLPKKG